jgi:hypothetical protein
MVKRECQNCDFWARASSRQGECHRHAPAMIPQVHSAGMIVHDMLYRWAGTAADDWCGDFQPKQEEFPQIEDRYSKKIKDFMEEADCSKRLHDAIINDIGFYGFDTVRDMLKRTKEEWLRTPNFGPACLKELKIILENAGFRIEELAGSTILPRLEGTDDSGCSPQSGQSDDPRGGLKDG